MEKIVKVVPVPEYFSIQWMLGSRCNYDCMYCPTELHDSVSRPHDLAAMQQVWSNIHDKTKHKRLPYKITFTGGEVTSNKNFLPLIEWLRDTYQDIAMILFTTNGSASRKHYERLSQLVESISFSTHSEFMDEQEFFDKVEATNKLMIRPKKSVHVNIMDEHWNQHRIPLYRAWLEQRGISHSVNRIDYSKQTRIHIMQQGKFNLAI